jgi:hypothetical protein
MFFLDENLPPQIARALEALGKPSKHITEISELGSGCPDSTWLPYIGDRGWTLLSRDVRTQRNPLEKDLFTKHKVRAFFLTGRGLSAWDTAMCILEKIPAIEDIIKRIDPPFAYEIAPHRGKLRPRPLWGIRR